MDEVAHLYDPNDSQVQIVALSEAIIVFSCGAFFFGMKMLAENNRGSAAAGAGASAFVYNAAPNTLGKLHGWCPRVLVGDLPRAGTIDRGSNVARQARNAKRTLMAQYVPRTQGAFNVSFCWFALCILRRMVCL